MTAFLNTAASAGFALVLARLTGPATVGAWALVLLAAALLAYFLGLSLGSGLRVRAQQEPRTDWFGAYWTITLATAVVGLIVGAIVSHLVMGQVDGIHSWDTAITGGLLCAALGLQAAAMWVGIATGRLAQVSLTAAAGTVVAAVTIIGCRLLTGSLPLWVICVAYAVGALPAPLYAHKVVREHRARQMPDTQPSEPFGQLFRASSGAYATGGLLAVLAAWDRFTLGRYAGVEAVGIYSAALAAASVARFVPSAVGQVLFARETDGGQADLKHRRRARLVVLAAQGLSAVVAPFMIVWFYGPQFRAAVPVALVLVVSEVFMGTALLEYRILAAKEQTRSLLLISGAMLLIVIPLYAFAAARGVLALAAAVTVQSALFAAALVVARRRFERRDGQLHDGVVRPDVD